MEDGIGPTIFAMGPPYIVLVGGSKVPPQDNDLDTKDRGILCYANGE